MDKQPRREGTNKDGVEPETPKYEPQKSNPENVDRRVTESNRDSVSGEHNVNQE